MGRYLSTNSCSISLNKTWRSYCKIRYLMSLLRKHPRLTKAPLCLDLHGNSPLSPRHPSTFIRNATLKSLNQNDRGSTSYLFLRDFTKGVKHLQVVRFYSSSNRNTFKAEAPIGILDESQSNLNLSSLGARLGQSFNRLSRHINYYFKNREVLLSPENATLIVATPEYVGRSQRRSQSHWATRERKKTEGKRTTQTLTREEEQKSSGTASSAHNYSGLQLFHISSLATTFGESYSYVANHINTAFSRGFAMVQTQETSETLSPTRGTTRRLKMRKVPNSIILSSKEAEISQGTSDANQVAAEPNSPSSSWEEGYLQLARHINKYFGAKVTGHTTKEQLQVENNSTYKKHLSTKSNSQSQVPSSQQKQDEPIVPEGGGLFHSSSNDTNFGENFFQMAGHINQYFKGPSGSEEDIDRDLLLELDPGSATPEGLKIVTLMDCLRHPTSAIPDLLGAYLNPRAQTKSTSARTSPERILNKKFFLSHRRAEEMTQQLIGALVQASTPEALTACVDTLNEHLIRYPSCKAVMWQEKIAVTLLRKRRAHRDNLMLQSALRETLALIGYLDPVKGRGIRVLSIDGGGTRGVVPLQLLKLLEAQTGKKIHQLFDYICGVSTGAVLAFMLGLAHFSLEECADMYRRFGSEVFRQNPLVGTVKMGWSHSYYNTETWETILQEKLGDRVLIKTARNEMSPKVSAVSAVVNWGTSPKAFVFRNYNHKPGSLSRYAGASGCQMWQAVRASSAAPGYFQEFTLQSDIHQDGGIILNNPCALAVHESRLLWPNQPFQCVLSLGTGRFDNVKRTPATSTSLRAKISNLISSATDTEGVHTLLDDLLAPDVYFRFNPMLSALVSLDESRPRALDQLQSDTQSYLERNRLKLARLCLVLGAERSAVSRTKDWMSERAWEVKQRWV
ncbi:calcium-independent phospholipase A2-gamma-like isoform X1 [Labrus bergylta]|uniref:Calcium-independent phospholipase A2-gamma-like n=2 Tax=Labrus bergylta TaxID=56723 RepID=A0A3Q3F6Y2_9LABR|nr:calcium-independent phospholipase A2-gamma-like [Labrus bergylta]